MALGTGILWIPTEILRAYCQMYTKGYLRIGCATKSKLDFSHMTQRADPIKPDNLEIRIDAQDFIRNTSCPQEVGERRFKLPLLLISPADGQPR